MAVHTKFTKEDFEKIISNYDLGKFKNSKDFKDGAVQTNILIETTKGRFVLRYYEHRAERYVLFEVNILNYFNNHNYPCAMPIINIHGELICQYKSKPYAIFEFVEGEHIKKPNQEQYKELVKYLAKLHQISKGYKPKYWDVRESHDEEYCWETSKIEDKRFKSKSKKENRLKWLRSELNKLKFPNSIPKGVCHCDYDISNLKFKGNKLVGVLDFDDACYTHIIFDVATLVYYWAWLREEKFDFQKARYLLKQYMKYRKMSKVEQKHIYDSLKMVVFTYIAWLFYDGEKNNFFKKAKDKIDWLNEIGREEFYKELFG